MEPSPKCKDLVKVFILRSGVVFTPEVGMKHVDRRWKTYPVRNKVSHQNLSMEQQSTDDGRCYQMDKSGQLHAQG